jgi:hypothetical protein
VKEDETGRACCVKNVCRALVGRAEGKRRRKEKKERDHTEDLGVDESILILVLEQ